MFAQLPCVVAENSLDAFLFMTKLDSASVFLSVQRALEFTLIALLQASIAICVHACMVSLCFVSLHLCIKPFVFIGCASFVFASMYGRIIVLRVDESGVSHHFLMVFDVHVCTMSSPLHGAWMAALPSILAVTQLWRRM